MFIDTKFFRVSSQGIEIGAKASPAGSGALPEPAPPKVGKGQGSLPSYLTTATPSTTSPLLRTDRALANRDLLEYRVGTDSRQVIRDFTRSDPNLSAAVTSYIRVGVTNGYTSVAKNLDGTVNADATGVLSQLLSRFNYLNDYTIGYDDGRSIRSLAEAFARQMFQTGAMCAELVLDKARLPTKIQPIATSQIRLFPSSDAKKLVPQQFIAGQYIDLDIPTFFMVQLDEDLQDAYPISPIESAIQATLFGVEFLNDLRRIMKRVVHPRQVFTLDEEKFRKNMPQNLLNDPVAIKAYMDGVLTDLKNMSNGLKPEDVLILFDTIGFSVVDHGNTNLSNEYQVIQGIADAHLSAGTKALPVVLGHSDGTANTASAETLLFMKFVEGTVWGKLNEMFSKMFTLAIRLLGQDCYVEFSFDAIDLKPKSELESFFSMKQSRVLLQLSLGMISDEEACIALTGHLPPAGYTPLTGTGFFPVGAGAQPAGDGNNGASNSGSTLAHGTRTTTPTKPKGGGGKTAEAEPHLSVVT